MEFGHTFTRTTLQRLNNDTNNNDGDDDDDDDDSSSSSSNSNSKDLIYIRSLVIVVVIIFIKKFFLAVDLQRTMRAALFSMRCNLRFYQHVYRPKGRCSVSSRDSVFVGFLCVCFFF